MLNYLEEWDIWDWEDLDFSIIPHRLRTLQAFADLRVSMAESLSLQDVEDRYRLVKINGGKQESRRTPKSPYSP